MSKFCLMMFSLVGSSPALVSPANSSGSLPPSQLPIFLPAIVAGLVMLAALNDAIRVPGALEDLGDRDEVRAALARLEHVRQPGGPDVGAAGRHDLDVVDVRAAEQQRDVEPGVPVVALVDRGVVARELRLGDPLELELDRRQDGERCAARRHRELQAATRSTTAPMARAVTLRDSPMFDPSSTCRPTGAGRRRRCLRAPDGRPPARSSPGHLASRLPRDHEPLERDRDEVQPDPHRTGEDDRRPRGRVAAVRRSRA